MQQKLVQNFLQQEVGAFGNNIEKKPQKPLPKLKHALPIRVVIFCKHVSIL